MMPRARAYKSINTNYLTAKAKKAKKEFNHDEPKVRGHKPNELVC
jgi:hypothetical protein